MNSVKIALILLLCNSFLIAQNTIGLISINEEESLGGYHLIYPNRQSTVFLMNECGQIVHQWIDQDSTAKPGTVAYLLENGQLLRAKNYPPLLTDPSFGGGGAGGIIELISWDNEILWQHIIANDTLRQHHDVINLPNGNILVLAWEKKELDALIALGYDAETNFQESLWAEAIFEFDPTTDSIVWEWHVWDHIVQDFDNSKPNYNDIANHPERIDINYTEGALGSDWLHANALDYNEDRDQIMIGIRNYNEIWIIDHSTTSNQAASNSGGNSDKGGNLLWRWGNPQVYKQGDATDQQLFWPHDAQWIDDFTDESYSFYGDIAVFNNFIDFIVDSLSRGQIISPIWNEDNQSYLLENEQYLPTEFSQSFVHPDTSKNVSSVASSIQIMGDGHVIMCAARQGLSFELDPNKNVVWEYKTPLQNGHFVEQGVELSLSENFTFQIERYPLDYAAFENRDLNPFGYLELNPNESFCMLSDINTISIQQEKWHAFPNPTHDELTIMVHQHELPLELYLMTIYGQIMFKYDITEPLTHLNLPTLVPSLYFLHAPLTKQTLKLLIK